MYFFMASFFCGSIQYVMFAKSILVRILMTSGLIQNFRGGAGVGGGGQK